jgi:transglutaminase-like putative cysteine protease
MDRRSFLKTAGLAAGVFAAAPVARTALAADAPPAVPFAPSPEAGWRVFELTTRVELIKPAGAAQVWLPLPSVHDEAWMRPMGNLWQGNADAMRVVTDPLYGASMLHARWEAGDAPLVEVVSRFAARDRAVDFTRAGRATPLTAAERRLFTMATELLPTDGIVRKTALEATRGATTDEAKARALYEWVVANTVREPKTRGCGLGDIAAMLESGNLGGKCADLNSLFVGMARAVGLPARDVYGLRVADSRFGYKSLGKSGDVSKAQHCRAEVWLEAHGWVPVDPADVRKVMLEEPPGNRGLDDEKVRMVHAKLFGAWETNWVALNHAHDLALPGSAGPKVPFLMYPQAETAAGRADSLDPKAFAYTLTAREIPVV